ncbi:hypothetical protein ACHAPO_000099 [Fusarium lateritium]
MEGNETPPASLATLPVELGYHIATFLANRDIKSLRLTSSSLHDRFILRLKRVFVSASPLDIKVLKEIANHEVFRQGVTEIIWDESAFLPSIKHLNMHLGHYVCECNGSIRELPRRKGNAGLPGRPDKATRQLASAMSRNECEQLYCELVDEQDRILKAGEDIKAFKYALDRFPSLRRVTISTKTHGRLFMPMYETPMIRSFPYGFVYRVPTFRRNYDGWDSSILWRDEQSENESKYSVYRRGVCSSLRVLAKHGSHKVSEFIIEDATPGTQDQLDYLSRFDNEDNAFGDLHSLIQRPGFSRLHLYAHGPMWHETLTKVENLRGLRICGSGKSVDLKFRRCVMQSLQSLVLRRLKLEAHSFITSVSPLTSLRCLVLDNPLFANECRDGEEMRSYSSENPHDFLNALRENDWRSRSSRPNVTIKLISRFWVEGEMLKLDSDVDKFLYENGENPFVPDDIEIHGRHCINLREDFEDICAGKGIELDEYDPEYERPNYDEETRERLGIASTRKRNIETIYRSWGDGEWGPRTCPPDWKNRTQILTMNSR